MREKRESDYTIELPEVGSFIFGKRTQGDKLAIRRLYYSLAGPEPDPVEDVARDYVVDFLAYFYACYAVLVVSCPKGWENAMDLPGEGEEGDLYTKRIYELARLLRDKEESFRSSRQGDGPGGGQGTVNDDRVLGQEKAQPPAK